MRNEIEQISDMIMQAADLIEKNCSEDACRIIAQCVDQHPEWADERMKAEIHLLMKQMEYKAALKDYAFLRQLSVAFEYAKAYYAEKAVLSEAELADDNYLPEKDTIWWCWLQGLEQAPEIVRRCYASLKQLGRKVIILDSKNYRDYIRLPEYIEDKVKKGMIGRAHYADLLRLELLTQKGGTWMDATVWISGTEQILPVLEEEKLFMYRAGNVSEHIIFDNWMIHAAKKSRILLATRKMLLSYWEKEDSMREYFMMHLMMTLACQVYRDEYENIPLFSNEPAHVLQNDLFHKYEEKRWKQILRMSDVHKLTYKFAGQSIEGTFLEHILRAE